MRHPMKNKKVQSYMKGQKHLLTYKYKALFLPFSVWLYFFLQ